MKRVLTFTALAAISFSACKKSNDDNGPQAPAAPEITGINMRDMNAQPVTTVGSPNVRTSFNSSEILCYPNPCTNLLTMDYKGNTGAAVKVWMVAAVYNNPPLGAKVENQSLFTQTNPLIVKTGSVGNTNPQRIAIAVDSLPNGFYKIYTTIGTDTLYDNIWLVR